jgi:hypothetical protein
MKHYSLYISDKDFQKQKDECNYPVKENVK